MEENLKIPNHVAIILDGNGRWAKAKGMPRNYGHVQGAKTVEVICEEAYRMGIQYLTVYAFSTENWNRPQDEVDALMKLLRNYMKTCLKTAEKNRMCVRVLGDKTRLDQDIQTRIAELEEATKNNDGLHFQIAINYGGRDEITRAVRRLSAKAAAGEISPEAITEQMISDTLDTHGIPEPDLLIRTCNELRISNFLLWQLAYTEFYFCDTYWPDFDENEFRKAIADYQSRERRFGKTSEQVAIKKATPTYENSKEHLSYIINIGYGFSIRAGSNGRKTSKANRRIFPYSPFLYYRRNFRGGSKEL